MGDILYAAPNITITAKSIVAGGQTIATDSVHTVWVVKASQIAPFVKLAGLAGLLLTLTMVGSCAGIFLGAGSEGGMDAWYRKALLIGCLSLFLLGYANRLPPFRYVVYATIPAGTVGIYQTPDAIQAEAIRAAIATARGLS